MKWQAECETNKWVVITGQGADTHNDGDDDDDDDDNNHNNSSIKLAGYNIKWICKWIYKRSYIRTVEI